VLRKDEVIKNERKDVAMSYVNVSSKLQAFWVSEINKIFRGSPQNIKTACDTAFEGLKITLQQLTILFSDQDPNLDKLKNKIVLELIKKQTIYFVDLYPIIQADSNFNNNKTLNEIAESYALSTQKAFVM
jgi:hypothetical protein